MAEIVIPVKKAIPIIIVTWVLSLLTTLAIAYFVPLVPIGADKIDDGAIYTEKIANDAIVTIKLDDGSVTSAKILDGNLTAVDLANGTILSIKIADKAVTDVKLAPQAIPFASTHATDFNTTTETTQYVDMSGMLVNLSLNRKSHLLILFNVEAYASQSEWISIRTLIGQDVAYPGEIYLTPNIYGSANETYLVDWAAYGYNFYHPSVDAGTHTIKIQWKISDGRGYVADRTLTVIALPE